MEITSTGSYYSIPSTTYSGTHETIVYEDDILAILSGISC